MSEVLKFKNALLARSIIARVKDSFEHSSPEALQKYLKDHPKADPKKHTVRKPSEGKSEHSMDDKEYGPNDPGPVPEIPKKKSTMFTEQEFSLPTKVTQKETDPEKLFKAADVAHEQQLDLLNRGKGLDKLLGAKVVRGDRGEKVSDEDTKGPVIVIGPKKLMSKAEGKVKKDYAGHWENVGDIVRSSIAFDSMGELEDTMKLLRKQGLKIVKKPKDRFAEPGLDGYRDVMMNIEYPNGHVGEIQLHVKPLIQAKKVGHKDYDIVTEIPKEAKEEGRDYLTPDEQRLYNQAMWRMRKLYDSAYAKLSDKNEGNAMSKEAFKSPGAPDLRKEAYFEYNGMPCVWNFPKLPVMTRPDGSTRIVYELGKFIQNASSISEKEYKDLTKEAVKSQP